MLLERLASLNPWWASDSHVPVPSRHRRELDVVTSRLMADPGPGALLILGFRRIGKTTLAFQAAVEAAGRMGVPHGAITYADFQEMDFAEVGPEEVIAAALERAPQPGPKLVILDEIQFVPAWDRKLRAACRRFAGAGLHVLATGSGTADMRRASGDILLDRVDVVKLEPLTFGERLHLEGRDWDRTQAELAAELEDFFVHGGFPGRSTALSGPFVVKRRTRELVERYVLEGDLGRRLKVRDMASLGRCAIHFLRHPGMTLDWERLPGEFGVSRVTFERWVKSLIQAELVAELEPSDPSGRPTGARKRYSKLYPIDHALAGAYGLPVDEGPGLETLVFRQLRDVRNRLASRGLTGDLTYWVDRERKGRNEIDFRWTSPTASLLVEVKATRAPSQQVLEAIASMASGLMQRRALLVCGVDAPLRFESRSHSTVTVLPLLEFLRRADQIDSDCEGLFA